MSDRIFGTNRLFELFLLGTRVSQPLLRLVTQMGFDLVSGHGERRFVVVDPIAQEFGERLVERWLGDLRPRGVVGRSRQRRRMRGFQLAALRQRFEQRSFYGRCGRLGRRPRGRIAAQIHFCILGGPHFLPRLEQRLFADLVGGEEFEPVFDQHWRQRLGFRHFGDRESGVRLPLVQHHPGSDQLLGEASRPGFPQPPRLGRQEIVHRLLLRLESRLRRVVAVDNLAARQRQLLVPRAGENARQTVVVTHGNRIELVVVATGASGGQSQKTTAKRVNPIIPFVGERLGGAARIRVVHGSEREKPECRQVVTLTCRLQQVARDLMAGELVVGHVRVQRVHNPVAIAIALGIVPRLECVGLVLAESSQVQPMPAPPFAHPRRCQQTIDQPRFGVRSRRRLELFDIVGRQWKSQEVDRQASSERRAIGVRSCAERFAFPCRLRETIDQSAAPRRVGNGGWRRTPRFGERPEAAIRIRNHAFAADSIRRRGRRKGSPHFDPLPQDRDLAVGEFPAGRHLRRRLVGHRQEKQTVGRLTSLHDSSAIPAGLQALARIEAQSAFLLALAMAGEALLGEQRTDLPFEKLGLLGT